MSGLFFVARKEADMIQIFTSAFLAAAGVMVTVAAWLWAGLLLLAAIGLTAAALSLLFDGVTGLLRRIWRKTGHKPRGKWQRIIQGDGDGR